MGVQEGTEGRRGGAGSSVGSMMPRRLPPQTTNTPLTHRPSRPSTQFQLCPVVGYLRTLMFASDSGVNWTVCTGINNLGRRDLRCS
jgi:hypothetical protein